MKNSRKLPITEFKRKCLGLIRSADLKHSPIEILKHGKVVAILSAPESVLKKGTLTNSVKYQIQDIANINFSSDWELS